MMASKSDLRAGVARRIISPPKGIFLIGYGDRSKGNAGVHDDLTATTLALDDGRTRIAVVALDMLAINEFIADRVRTRLAPVEVLLCCSHTHSGPIAYADEKSPHLSRQFINTLVDRVVESVEAAQASLAPARLEYSCGEANVGINRREKMPDGHMEIGRNPAGPRDRSLQVLSVLGVQDGKEARLATLVNYACHGTVLGPDNLLVSADWIGYMRCSVEAELGGMALFLQGAAANINPDMYWGDADAFRKAETQGQHVAAAVLAAVLSGSAEIETLPLRLERTVAWMPTEAPAVTRRPPKNYGRQLLAMAHLPGFLAIFAGPLLNQRYPWKPVIEPRDGMWAVPMRINAVRIGELALVTFGAETFTEIGMKVKAASPAPHTLFGSVTDGCISYLHTEESHAEGGFEVDVAPLPYRYPGRLQARCESIALAETQQLLTALWKS